MSVVRARRWGSFLVLLAVLALSPIVRSGAVTARTQGAADEFNDSHFHLTNYVQQGISVQDFLEDHGPPREPLDALRDPAPAAVVVRNSGTTRRPTTCRATRRSTTTRSPTPYIASQYRTLSKEEQARFDPMITGFNPADMYAVDHIRRVLLTFRASSPASASSRFTRNSSRRKSPARRRVSPTPRSIASSTSPPKSGLVVILHSDIDMPFAKTDAEPVYLKQMKDLLARHPKTSIIWAHTGLGRIVHPVQRVG